MSLSKYVILFIGALLLHSCTQKKVVKVPENKIEIYLTNKLVLKEHCVLMGEYKPYVDSLKLQYPNQEIKLNFYRHF